MSTANNCETKSRKANMYRVVLALRETKVIAAADANEDQLKQAAHALLEKTYGLRYAARFDIERIERRDALGVWVTVIDHSCDCQDTAVAVEGPAAPTRI